MNLNYLIVIIKMVMVISLMVTFMYGMVLNGKM